LAEAGLSSDFCGRELDRACARASTARGHDGLEPGQLNDSFLRPRSEVDG